jgi:hypothetical protein
MTKEVHPLPLGGGNGVEQVASVELFFFFFSTGINLESCT